MARQRFELMVAMGRPREADSAFRIFEQNAEHPLPPAITRVTRSVFIDGDTAGLARAVAMLERAQQESRSVTPADSIWRLAATCVLAEWHLNARRTAAARAVIARLSDAIARGEPAADGANSGACATVVGAWAAALDGGPGRLDTLRALDSLMRLGIVHNGFIGGVGESNLIAARAFEELGDHRGALAAVRRRVHHFSPPMFMGTSIRQEARLADLAGDREGAIRAYRQWLAMHDNPEPSVLPEVAEVKAELAKLVGEP